MRDILPIHELRKALTWLFAFSAVVCLFISVSLVPKMLHEHPPLSQLPLTSKLLLIFLPWVLPLQTVVFGMAWWTSFKVKASARFWGILGSLINLLVAVAPLFIPPHSIWNMMWVLLGLGIVGLGTFARPQESLGLGTEVQEHRPIPHDGTSEFLNMAMLLLGLVAGGAAFFWWEKWIASNEIFIPHTNSYLLAVSVLLGFLIVTLHELGHTIVALAFGMKLRAFIAGPFEWRIRDGKWGFRFYPMRILADSGATGMVPMIVNFPRSSYFCVLIGGIFVNAITGVVALWFALNNAPDSPTQAGGFLALFGAWSLAGAAINLIPFRTGTNYSDGAQIYQLLANGPWADLHRAFMIAGSTLVTPLRPKDYDIDAILRAGRTINQGIQGMLLWFLAYNYYLDVGRNVEAAGALREAGVIYNESATDVPAELLTPFVFGGAYLWHDLNMTRQWWEQLQAKKPTRFNVDYWLASSALHWVEGRSEDANTSLAKANALAQQLPHVGAYEFDRYCCSLLRNALDETPGSK